MSYTTSTVNKFDNTEGPITMSGICSNGKMSTLIVQVAVGMREAEASEMEAKFIEITLRDGEALDWLCHMEVVVRDTLADLEDIRKDWERNRGAK